VIRGRKTNSVERNEIYEKVEREADKCRSRRGVKTRLETGKEEEKTSILLFWVVTLCGLVSWYQEGER
jgi:aminopeptidase-like protein